MDWSGRRKGERRTIWLAEARGGRLHRLENGRSRQEIAEQLIEMSRHDPRLIVGLDFAFSLPGWFLQERGLSRAPELWKLAVEESERWIAECEPPFWGHSGRKRPDLPVHFRVTELGMPSVAGIRPKSVFQIGGAGAVGTGSLRGFPVLHRLHQAGFSIWPFDAAQLPLVIEIYPRVLTHRVNKSDPSERQRYLEAHAESLEPQHLERAASSEDAFDATVSALLMMQNLEHILALQRSTHRIKQLEGEIWIPE